MSAAPVAPTGGVYVIVIVQLEPAAGGAKVPPGLMGAPTAQLPPSAKVPVAVSGVSVMAVGRYGPASGFVFGLAVLVTVMVPNRVVPAERNRLSGAAKIHGQVCIPLCLRRADGVKDHVDHATLSRAKWRSRASIGLDGETWHIASSSHSGAINHGVAKRQRGATRVNYLYVLIQGCRTMSWHKTKVHSRRRESEL